MEAFLNLVSVICVIKVYAPKYAARCEAGRGMVRPAIVSNETSEIETNKAIAKMAGTRL